MTAHKVTFTRIGRTRDLPPLIIETEDDGALLDAIHAFARPYLRSSDYEVALDGVTRTGVIRVGMMHDGGRFKVESP